MNNTYLSALLLALFFSCSVQAQHRCSSNTCKAQLEMKEKYSKKEYNNDKSKSYLINKNRKKAVDLVTLPVHVIIVHPPGQGIGNQDNFSLEHVQSQIEVLNQDFRRLNTDANLTPSVFSVGDPMIEFCLASFDPDGNPTDGITRFATNLDFTTNESSIMQQTIWDRDFYLNIYVVPNIESLGYSPVPSLNFLPNRNSDAIVVLNISFGGEGFATIPYYNLGRTTTHEIGHWLGLDHVWGPTSGGCSEDDGMDDTPLQNEPSAECPVHPRPSCNNSGDMFMNYMDYSDDICMNAFSNDQIDYMHLILDNSRVSLRSAAESKCGISVVPVNAEISTIINPCCADESTGAISINILSGTPPYTYTLNGLTTNDTGTFENLPKGDYSIEIEDANDTNITIEATLLDPQAILLFPSQINEIVCAGDESASLFVTASGGNGAPYALSLNGDNIELNTTFENLPKGDYLFEIVDNKGCFKDTLITILEPDFISTNIINLNSPLCHNGNDGSIEVSASGGTGNLTYEIGNMSNQTGIFSGLSSGDYQVNVMDENDCVESNMFNLSNPSMMDVTASVILPTCGDENGSIMVMADGGSGPYQYQLDNLGFSDQSNFVNLEPGTYLITVLDENDCSIKVEENLTGSDEINYTVQLSSPTCTNMDDGSITITFESENTSILSASAGTVFPNTIQGLSSGSVTFSIIDENDCVVEETILIPEAPSINLNINNLVQPICSNQGSVSWTTDEQNLDYFLNGDAINVMNNSLEDLSPGMYTLIVVNDSNCEEEANFEIEESNQIQIMNIQTEMVSCDNANDGRITFDIAGDQTGLVIYINNIQVSSTNIPNLDNGDYTLIIENMAGCTDQLDVSVENVPELVINSEIVQLPQCNGSEDAILNISAAGGTPPFSYFIDGIAFSGNINLGAGIYELSIVDSRLCDVISEVTISEPSAIELENVDTTPASFGASNGSVIASVMGGTAPYIYTLNEESNTTGSFDNLSSGIYEIEVVDDNGCEFEVSFEIEELSSVDNLKLSALSMHPNPSEDFVNIQHIPSSDNFDIIVYNYIGEIVLSTKSNFSTRLMINVSQLPNGLYYVNVQNENLEQKIMPLLKQD